MNPTRPIVATLTAALALAACSDSGSAGSTQHATPEDTAALAISPTRMKAHIDTLADDALGGRICGSPGHDTARDYVKAQLAASGLEPFGDGGDFALDYASIPFGDHYQKNADGSVVPNATDRCTDLVGILRGSEHPEDMVVLAAHYDHLGVTKDGDPFNGAFDDASGVAGLLEVARAMVAAGVKPKRSIVFLISDQEESGWLGAGAFIDKHGAELDHIVVDIACDPIGRGLLPDHAPIIISGAERSGGLLDFVRSTAGLSDRPLGFIHRTMIPVFGSDQDQFFSHGLPGFWLVSPGMTYYHMTTDDADTIDYAVLRDVARYLLHLSLAIANSDQRFTYNGDQALDMTHAQDVRDVLAGVTTSSVITGDERSQVQGYVDQLDQVLASQSWSAIDSPQGFFAGALAYVAFTLPRNHPGDTPPAFPVDPAAP